MKMCDLNFVTLEQVSKQTNLQYLSLIVTEQLKVIDNKLATAHRAGVNFVMHELPLAFGVTCSISKQDAKIFVWSEILNSITAPAASHGRGFKDVYITMEGGTPQIIIKWETGLSPEEKEKRLAMIQQYMPKK